MYCIRILNKYDVWAGYLCWSKKNYSFYLTYLYNKNNEELLEYPAYDIAKETARAFIDMNPDTRYEYVILKSDENNPLIYNKQK